MKNALEKFREAHGVTFEQMAESAGFKSRSTVFHHCKGLREIGAEAAVRYEKTFGIPRSELRPDLWPPTASPTSTPEPDS